MSSYRFCRTDDIGLLVDALNRCWSPYFPEEPAITPAAFKRWIRDLQVWCSSCMVAFSGGDPIGVLIGAKRTHGTLVHRIAVAPDHRRQGHARHLLESLGSKLAILGPPRILAEVPEANAPACAVFRASGYVSEAVLTDYVWQAEDVEPRSTARIEGLLIPVTVDDLAANDLLQERQPTCWARSIETLTARKDEIAGIAVASDERLEAFILYAPGEDGSAELLSLGSIVEDAGARVRWTLAGLRAQGVRTVTFPRVHPAEAAGETLEVLGFKAAGRHLVWTAGTGPAAASPSDRTQG